jgi:RNA polymerase sigma-70 factor (ECF subfamily)
VAEAIAGLGWSDVDPLTWAGGPLATGLLLLGVAGGLLRSLRVWEAALLVLAEVGVLVTNPGLHAPAHYPLVFVLVVFCSLAVRWLTGGVAAGGPGRRAGRPAAPPPSVCPAQPRIPRQGPAMMGTARAAKGAWAGMASEPAVTAAADDDELVRAVAAGDRRALELLYRRHAPWLAGRLAARTSSRDLAEEALQDTFLAAWRGARGYHGTGEVPAWLWGIARRRLASLARRQPRGGLSLEAAGERVDPATGPEEATLGRDASARIRAAVAHLPDEQRAAITAVVYQGQTIEQAALAAKVAEGTIKSRLHRARLQIRRELQP